MDCPICDNKFNNIRGLMPHIKLHGYNSQKLYDQFVKKNGEGFCIVCNKETKYTNYTLGYYKFCSSSCSGKYNATKYWNSNSLEILERKERLKDQSKKMIGKGGRKKGSKNKNPYPKTEKVLNKYLKNPPPSWLGKKHTEDTKEKMSVSRTLIIENGDVKMGSYKGQYQPINPKKYKGDFRKIVYRSLWERKFMKYCDTNENILEWSSEEIFFPYFDPTTNKVRRYFPDFYIKVKESNGEIKKCIIEIKPKKQTVEPIPQKKKTKGYIYEVYEYARNQAKWKAAIEYCKDRQWEFKVLTENELGV